MVMNSFNRLSLFGILGTFLFFGFVTGSHWTGERGLKLTHIANSGFLIESGGKKVIIDALFSEGFGVYSTPHESTIGKIINGKVPFNDIDLMLITHDHADHFSDSLVALYLINNKKSLAVVPPLVIQSMKKHEDFEAFNNQLIQIGQNNRLIDSLNFKDITVTAFQLPHGNRNDIENIGYLIEIEGFKIFHSGDNTCAEYYGVNNLKLCEKGVDVALLFYSGFWRNEEERINTAQHLNPRKIVLMHLPFNEVETIKKDIKLIDNYIEIILFEKSMENIILKSNN